MLIVSHFQYQNSKLISIANSKPVSIAFIKIATMKSQMPSSKSIQDLPVAKRAKLVPPSPQTQTQTQPPPAPASRIDFHIMSIVRTLTHQEQSTVYKPLPYLENAAVSAQNRQKLYHWGTTVLDACEVDRQLATVAITFFDRFLGHRDLRSVEVCLASEREFQLAYIMSYYSCDSQFALYFY